MKLNKKGFTLIELLAVVVILLAISVIAVTSINAAIERNKVKQNDAKKEVIVSYAKLYYEEHKNSLPSSGCISVVNLKLSDVEKVDADGKYFDGYVEYNNGSKFEYIGQEIMTQIITLAKNEYVKRGLSGEACIEIEELDLSSIDSSVKCLNNAIKFTSSTEFGFAENCS